MNKLTDQNLSKLSKYLQSHREKSSLSLKIKFSTNKQQNLQIIKVIEKELSQLTHLTHLALTISKRSILTAEGYRILSNSVVLNLKSIKRLSFIIFQDCSLENEGLSILKEMVNKLPELVYLKFETYESNQITAGAAQEFLDSLVVNSKLTTLKLMFKETKNSLKNEENYHFWRGLALLNNLQNLQICLQTDNYGFSDLVELFFHIAYLKKIRKLNLTLVIKFILETHLLEELFAQVGQMIELRSLKIHYTHNEIILNDTQRKTILLHLSKLKLLEKLELNQLEQILLKDSFVEYANMIKDMKCLKALSWDITNSFMKSNQKICTLGQSLLEFNNLLNLKLVLELGDDRSQKRFFSDLSVSFSQMHNLLSLTLAFEENEISEIGCSILEGSFLHLQRLEEFDLKLSLPETVQTGLLYSIRKMSNLKKLVITPNNIKIQEDYMLLDSIVKLNNLETLKIGAEYTIQNGNDNGIQRLKSISDSFMKLTNLKSLQCGFYFQILNSQGQMEMLKRCFENLQSLECLKLNIWALAANDDIYESLIDNLANLKRIEISFERDYWNIFGSSAQMGQNLEYCSITSNYMAQEHEFLKTFESLSQLNIKRLNLEFPVETLTEEQRGQFETTCSKLKSLEKLSFIDKGYDNLMIYINGIKEMKQLKSLKLVSTAENNLTSEDIQVFKKSLKELKNLQKLTVKLKLVVLIDDTRDLLELNSLTSFGNLKRCKFDIGFQIEDELLTKSIDVRQACTLDQQTLQLSTQNQLRNEDNSKTETGQDQELNPTEIKIDMSVNSEESTMILNDVDFQNLKYLNNLQFTSKFEKQSPIQLELLQPLRDLTSESKLERLIIKLNKLALNEEQINYLSRNIKFLTNLQYLKFEKIYSNGCYSLFLDSFKQLTNLHSLVFYMRISNNEAISLGSSLKSMTNLQICHLLFEEESTLNYEGICSIFNGLKYVAMLKELVFQLNTVEIVEEISPIQISECISNLKHLILLQVYILQNIQINSISLRDFFTSIGSLEHLNILELEINEINPFNQEMLDELIKSLNKLRFLNDKNISIYLDTSKPINISQDFATLYNMNPSCSLSITNNNEDEMIVEQSKYAFTFKWVNLENLEISFLEYLDKNIEVSIKTRKVDSKHFTKFAARKIFLSYSIFRYSDIDFLNGFLTKMQNIFDLIMVITLDWDLDQEKLLQNMSECLTKLNTLRILNLRINSYKGIAKKILIGALKILKKMDYLEEFYLITPDLDINKQMIPKIQRALIRQVNLDEEKQLNYY